MATDKKFSDFVDGGEMQVGDIPAGLRTSDLINNYKFNFPGAGFKDANGNYLFKYESAGSIAVNAAKVFSSVSGNAVIYTAEGTDANINVSLQPKANGQLILDELFWPTADGPPNSSLVTDGAGNLFFSTSGSTPFIDVTGTSQIMSQNTGYLADNVGLVTFTLPMSANFGSILIIQGFGAGGWKINQNSLQQIIIGSFATTIGLGGSVASTNKNDSLVLRCVSTNTVWSTEGAPQSSGLTIV